MVFTGEVDDRQPIKLDGQSEDWTYAKTLPAAFRVQPFPPEPGLGRAVKGETINAHVVSAWRRV